MLNSESRRLYSWWWDSHISPKNSKWLLENLTDMDTKVKSMIKLIEEDADSFARRAEMYYKKRPELMKLVEEFYRAYRALAERYDYATGELKHAQRTLQAAFPDQVHFSLQEELSSSITATRSQSSDDDQNNESFSFEIIEAKIFSETERANKAEVEIEKLKKALTELTAEKESLLVEYRESLEKICNADGELNRALEKLKILDGIAIEAEKEVHMLKESLRVLQAEKDAGLAKQMEYLETISDLEEKIEETRGMSESEVKDLMEKLTRLESENDSGLLEYGKCLERITVLEEKIAVTESESRTYSEEAAKAEREVEKLRTDLAGLTEEKEALRVLYAESLEKSYKLERDLFSAQSEIETITKKLRNAEEICVRLEISNQNLKMEASDLAKRIMLKDQELSERHDEFEKLRVTAKNEHTNYVKIEAALETLQMLYTRSQEEQRTLENELKNTLQMLKDLKEIEITGLKEIKERLEEEVALQLGQSNAMKDEILGLKEEIFGLNSSYGALMSQLESVGLSPESIGSSVKHLQDENSRLKRIMEKDSDEQTEKIEELIKKNSSLESSYELLHGEQSALVLEKTVLLSQLHIITVNMQKLGDQNTVLETALSTANIELENLREKSKGLESLCELLNAEKSNLVAERGILAAELESVRRRLEALENRFTQFEIEKETGRAQIRELMSCLSNEKKERESFMIRNQEFQDRILEESKSRKDEFQEELDKAVIAQFENFILHKFIQEVEEKNYELLVESEKHVKASKLADKLISELETEILEQQVEEELLLVEVENLRFGIYQVFLALEVGSIGGQETAKISVEDIIKNIKNLKRSLKKEEDDKQRLLMEKNVILTLLKQLESEFRESEKRYGIVKNDLENENFLMKCTIEELESKLEMTEEMNSELESAMEGMVRKCTESELKIDAFEKETECLREVNGNLGLELDMLHEELEERKNIEENLNFELQERENEFELWEAEATSFIFDLQISNTRDILFENKVHELAGVCESLESQTVSKDREIEEMKRKASIMESEIEGLRAELLAYNPVIGSLKKNITSFENNFFTMANLVTSNGRKSEDMEVKVHPHHHHENDPTVESTPKSQEPNGISDLIEFQTRITALEKIIVEDINAVTRREISPIHTKPKPAKTETQDSNSQQKKLEKLRGKRYLTLDNLNLTKPKPETSEPKKGIPMRDIPLDQASDGSSSTNSRSRSRRAYSRTDDIMIEQLQIAHETHKMETEKKLKRLPYEPQIEDLGVDKLEVVPIQDSRKCKLLDRLASDAQKLANLETIVKDLSKKLETGKKGNKKQKGFDFETVKEQLEEAEETILRLVNVNVESMASVEKNPSLSVWVEQDDAWKESERIKRVQLEVQKIQYVLLKVEDDKKTKGKSRFSRTKSRTSVILRDFIHRGGRSGVTGRRKRLCGCFTPSATKGDHRVKMSPYSGY
ncbi:hypothetical protein L2E82_38358 [Cichorium intybus]|uniref:Uncharacterized protein n=1 Tax=Cichorium intybus TaxID=13427 RepID=A0ACB9AG70_CICIN|nr:hypothetical protein L2E82_38358 [Cichorium intybus]